MAARPGVALAALLLAIAAVVPAARANDHSGEALLLPWQRLDYSASKLFVRGSVRLEVTALSRTEAQRHLTPAPEYAPLQPGPNGALILQGTFSLLSNTATMQVLIDPSDLHAYQRLRYSSGRDTRAKLSRFLADGVLWQRKEPDAATKHLSPLRWPTARQLLIPYPDALAKPPRMLESTTLFVVLGTAPLRQPGDTVTIPVLTDKDTFSVTLSVKNMTQRAVDYTMVENGRKRSVAGRINTLAVSLTPSLVGEPEDPEPFSLMELTGKIIIYLEPAYRLPVEIEGQGSIDERVTVKLQQAILGNPRPAEKQKTPASK